MTNEWLVEQGRIETLDCDCQLLMKMNDPSWLSPETSLILRPRSLKKWYAESFTECKVSMLWEAGIVYSCISLCVSPCVCVRVSVCQSVCLCTCLSVCQSVRLRTCLSVCQSVRLCTCLCVSVYMSVCVSARAYVYMSVCMSVCAWCVSPCVCVHVCLRVSLCVCVHVCLCKKTEKLLTANSCNLL